MPDMHPAEALELAAMQDLHAAADAHDIENLGLEQHRIGSAWVSLGGHLPDSAIVVNRCLGLGLEQAATRDEVAAVVGAYAEAGVGQCFVQITGDARPERLRPWLEAEGLHADRAWQKFARGPAAVEPARSDLQVREIDSDRGGDFGAIVCPAFDLGDAAAPWLAKLPGRDGWHIFMSFDGDQPAGVGALYVRDGYAWTDWGATAPEYRKRGSQSALMAARLERAFELGCSEVFTCTGVAVPGDPQHSYSNILRAGFRETYIRDNYAPR